jgi:hypothetical protein
VNQQERVDREAEDNRCQAFLFVVLEPQIEF